MDLSPDPGEPINNNKDGENNNKDGENNNKDGENNNKNRVSKTHLKASGSLASSQGARPKRVSTIRHISI